MDSQISLSLDGKLKSVLLRGLNWYKQGLNMMRKVIFNIADARSIQQEILSVEHVIGQLEQQTYKSLPKETVLNQTCTRSFIKKTISELPSNPRSRVLGWVADDQWLEVRYIQDKGYQLRVQDELVRETRDLEGITEAFVSWGKRRKIGIKEKAH